MSRDHRKLRAFELANELAFEAYCVTRAFPREELFGLTSQIRRAAVSAAANIVEGAGRDGDREFAHFLSQAFASLREVGYLLGLSKRLGYLTDSKSTDIAILHAETSRVLAALMTAVKGRVQRSGRR